MSGLKVHSIVLRVSTRGDKLAALHSLVRSLTAARNESDTILDEQEGVSDDCHVNNSGLAYPHKGREVDPELLVGDNFRSRELESELVVGDAAEEIDTENNKHADQSRKERVRLSISSQRDIDRHSERT